MQDYREPKMKYIDEFQQRVRTDISTLVICSEAPPIDEREKIYTYFDTAIVSQTWIFPPKA